MILTKYSLFFILALFTMALAWAQVPKAVDFKKGTIQINKVILKAEFAQTDEQQQYGLMNRAEIPDDYGMLFIFDDEDYRSFWMKNTFVDLSIAYIGTNKKILEIIDMEASKSSTDANPATYPSKGKAKYALEVKRGWFKKNRIKVGDKIKNISIK